MTLEELQEAFHRAETDEEKNRLYSDMMWARINNPEAVADYIKFINGED